MNIGLMFPKDMIERGVDYAFTDEYNAALQCGFKCLLFDQEKLGKVYGNPDDTYLYLYRGWMLYLHEYTKLWENIPGVLITTPEQYKALHYSTECWQMVRERMYTPKYVAMTSEQIDVNENWDEDGYIPTLKFLGDYFIMKDDVKSVKGNDFPQKISTLISGLVLKELTDKFKRLRDKLFTGRFVFKEYRPLKKYGDTTNEYRVFYFMNEILTISQNSNQPENAKPLLEADANRLKDLPSPFYTVDFAKMENGEWMVVETGDGGVSGLSPNQNPLMFYASL